MLWICAFFLISQHLILLAGNMLTSLFVSSKFPTVCQNRQVIFYVINLLLWILWQSSQLFGSLDGTFPFMEVRYPEKLGFFIVIFRPMYYVWHILFNSLCFLPFLVSMDRVRQALEEFTEMKFKRDKFWRRLSLLNTQFYCNKNTLWQKCQFFFPCWFKRHRPKSDQPTTKKFIDWVCTTKMS